jgi:hypothetical protein
MSGEAGLQGCWSDSGMVLCEYSEVEGVPVRDSEQLALVGLSEWGIVGRFGLREL